MVRFILLFVLILLILWILWPFLKTNDRTKSDGALDRALGSNKGNFWIYDNIFLIVTVIFFFTLLLWILPKFGINLLSIFQKIIPLLSTLRGILPF